MVVLFANSGDPDQMPHSAASDLGLHYLPITLLGVSRLQWVKLVLLGQNHALSSDAAQNYKNMLPCTKCLYRLSIQQKLRSACTC